ncbi:MAG: hypothetical protein R3244_08815, partial [Thermoanaerobaculia bacterium]|nr:hypothetical protein [Thermoanaerobaculia bacterium]
MRRSAGRCAAALAVLLLPSAVPASGPGSPLDLFEVTRDLETLRPEEPGTVAAEASHRLLSWMRAAGLDRVEANGGNASLAASLTGVLRGVGSGEEEREVILVGTVGEPTDPAWRRDARASAVALTAASRLAVLPRHHTVRLLLLDRAGGTARAAAARWVGELSSDRRGRLLAVVDLDGVGRSTVSPEGIVRLAPVGDAG